MSLHNGIRSICAEQDLPGPEIVAFLHQNQVMTNPPLSITEEQLAEGFAVLDEALEITDRAVTG